MSIKIVCPSCGRMAAVPERLLGHRCKCPGCGERFIAPDSPQGRPRLVLEDGAGAPGAELSGHEGETEAGDHVDPGLTAAARGEPASGGDRGHGAGAKRSPRFTEPLFRPEEAAAPVRPGRAKPPGSTGRWIATIAGVAVVLGAAGGYLAYRQGRAPAPQAALTWEQQNKAKMATLKREADDLAAKGMPEAAFAKYDALLLMFEGQRLTDPEVIAVLRQAQATRSQLEEQLAEARRRNGTGRPGFGGARPGFGGPGTAGAETGTAAPGGTAPGGTSGTAPGGTAPGTGTGTGASIGMAPAGRTPPGTSSSPAAGIPPTPPTPSTPAGSGTGTMGGSPSVSGAPSSTPATGGAAAATGGTSPAAAASAPAGTAPASATPAPGTAAATPGTGAVPPSTGTLPATTPPGGSSGAGTPGPLATTSGTGTGSGLTPGPNTSGTGTPGPSTPGSGAPGTAPHAAGPATRPLTPDEEAVRLGETFNVLLDQGIAALAAGEPKAAMDLLADAKLVFDKRVRLKATNPGSPEHVSLLHGLAIVYQLTGKPEKASPLFDASTPLDRACAAKAAPRQLLLTRGALDAQQGYLALRTAVRLSEYLKDHPTEVDSEILDVMFTALQKAEERVNNRQMLDQMIKQYEQLNADLELTRPGQKRWGVQWVSTAVFHTEMAARQRAVQAYEAALATVDRAWDNVKDAERTLANAKSYGSRAQINSASARLGTAKNDHFAAKKAAEQAKKQIPPVPSLTTAQMRAMLVPRDVTIFNTMVAGAGGGAGAKPATGTGRAPTAVTSSSFSLGGGAVATAKAAGTPGGTGSGPGPAVTTPSGSNTTGSTGPTGGAPTAAADAVPRRKTYNRGATGFAVGPDLFLTSADAVRGARRITIEFPDAQPIDAELVRAEAGGLALLRARGRQYYYLNPGGDFAGGNLACPCYPDVSVFGVRLEVIAGRANAAKEKWIVNLARHPRLPGAPLLDGDGALVGVVLADRDDRYDQCPAVPASKVKAFLGSDLPATACPTPKNAPVVQITAVFEK